MYIYIEVLGVSDWLIYLHALAGYVLPYLFFVSSNTIFNYFVVILYVQVGI